MSEVMSNFPFTFHFHALVKEIATHSSVLAWRIPGMGEPGGLVGCHLRGVTGKFCLGIRNEAGQRLIEFCQENALVIANTLFQVTSRLAQSRLPPSHLHSIFMLSHVQLFATT